MVKTAFLRPYKAILHDLEKRARNLPRLGNGEKSDKSKWEGKNWKGRDHEISFFFLGGGSCFDAKNSMVKFFKEFTLIELLHCFGLVNIMTP